MPMQVKWQHSFPKPGTPGLYWLGQAGFWIETGRHRILIDPYLSDSLARKYAGKQHDHKRMMPPPITVEDLPMPDLILVTHAHTDHMDPDTLAPLHRRFPDVPFMVPAACTEQAKERVGATTKLLLADADQVLRPLPDLEITVFPAAHEDLRTDTLGRHVFLGYGIQCGDLKVYHSGDSIPFEGLQERVDLFAPDAMLLPVNGRDAERLAAGIPGNFTLEEAIDLAKNCKLLVPHHFDMFAFNTLDPKWIDLAARQSEAPRIERPLLGQTMLIEH